MAPRNGKPGSLVVAGRSSGLWEVAVGVRAVPSWASGLVVCLEATFSSLEETEALAGEQHVAAVREFFCSV